MITTISIWLCKLITKVCNLFGRDGSVFPGSIIRKYNKNVLWHIKYPEYVICVTGSSGKGSLVSLLAHILESSGKKVVWNKYESNINNAIVTTILNSTKGLSHKVDADIVLLEMDERFIKGMFKSGTISHLLITNITRDQPSRNVHPEFIYNVIKDAIDDKMHLVINADDPLLNRFKYAHHGKISTYGIDKTKYSQKEVPNYAVDCAYCPKCHTKLEYKTYHYGNLGIYSCPNCEFERGKIDFEASKVDLKNATFEIDKETYKLNKNVFFAVYYTLGAYALSKLVGIDDENIKVALNENMIEPRRMNNVYNLRNRTIELLEPKNENSLSYIQSLNYIDNIEGIKTIIIGFEKVSRRYLCRDVSWLWDINFELLNKPSIDKVFVFGPYKYDIATRLYYAGIQEDKLVLLDDATNLLDRVLDESTGNIYALVGEDIKKNINEMLKEESHEEESN